MDLTFKNESENTYLFFLKRKIDFYTIYNDKNNYIPKKNISNSEHKLSQDLNTFNRRLFQCKYRDFKHKNKNKLEQCSNQLSKNSINTDFLFLKKEKSNITWKNLSKEEQKDKIKNFCVSKNLNQDKISDIIISYEKNIIKNSHIIYNNNQHKILNILNFELFLQDNSIENIMTNHITTLSKKKSKNVNLNLFFK
jgi:hypothetical protein